MKYLFYRTRMKWLHARGKHHYETRPLDGLQRCNWCGAFEPHGLYANKLLNQALQVADSGHYRDRAAMSIAMHPVFERIRAFFGESPLGPAVAGQASQANVTPEAHGQRTTQEKE